jgi:3-oxoacyl-[acyl-carrier-protein] synthase-3
MVSKAKARIVSTGSYLPKKVLTNGDLEKLVDTSDEWITSRTGIKERRIAGKDEHASDMGAAAALVALERIGFDPSQVDLILVATMSPDYWCPSTAALIQTKIKATHAGAMDIQAACSGYLYGLSTAKAFVESGMYRNVLLIAAEKMSALVDYTDRNTCVLFGDGATAALISSEGSGFLIDTVCLGADGEMSELLMVPAGGTRKPPTQETVLQREHFIKMTGKEIFKHAVRRMGNAAKECLQKTSVSEENIRWLIPHQANLRIMDAIAEQMNMPTDKVYKTIHKYGNTSASSVGIALDEVAQNKEIINGEHILLLAFGGGLSWGASLLTCEF